MAKREYRVVWQRKGRVQYVKRYSTRKGADIRYSCLTSKKPWSIPGFDEFTPDETPPPLLYVRLESREVGEWEPEVTP